MGLHPYCVVPPGATLPPGLRGIGGAEVCRVDAGELGVWVSEAEAAPEADAETLRAHDRVIRAGAGDDVVPLPVRFGGWAPSRETLVARVRRRETSYREALRRLAGSREFGLRIFAASGSEPEKVDPPGVSDEAEEGRRERGPGRAYLEAVARRRDERQRRERRADAAREALKRSVGRSIRDERVEPLPADGSLVAVAHLVNCSDAEAYLQDVERFRRGRPDLRVVRTGPWAPYSFAP